MNDETLGRHTVTPVKLAITVGGRFVILLKDRDEVNGSEVFE
jgi:hypothetical protein